MDYGNSFVLAQEDAYEAQLVAQDIPRVALIPTGADDDSLSVTRGIPKSAKV
jgi:hypothetical protein